MVKTKINIYFVMFLLFITTFVSVYFIFNSASITDYFSIFSTLKKKSSLKNKIIFKITAKSVKDKNTTPKSTIEPTSKDLNNLKITLQNYLNTKKGTYGIYYEDISTNTSIGINENTEFTAASTIKLPLNYMLYKKVEAGQVNLNSTLSYLSSDYEGGTGSIQGSKVGSVYSLRKLSELSIRVSDNIATNMLFRKLGGSVNCKKYFKTIGGTLIDTKRNITCAKDMGLYSKLVYNFSISNPSLGNELTNNLVNTIFNDRIPQLLPSTIKIAHKVGNYNLFCHDVGIVYTNKPYIICIMSTAGKSIADEASTIANISKIVYDFHLTNQ